MGRKSTVSPEEKRFTEGKREIINEIIKLGWVEECVNNTVQSSRDYKQDLIQEIYVYLMELPETKLKGLWERDELKWWISRMISNQYNSVTSQFYRTYRRPLMYDDIHVKTDEEGGDEDDEY